MTVIPLFIDVVVTDQNAIPVANANVQLVSVVSTLTATTDATGTAVFSVSSSGSYTVIVSKPGYQVVSEVISFDSTQSPFSVPICMPATGTACPSFVGGPPSYFYPLIGGAAVFSIIVGIKELMSARKKK